VSGKPYVLRCRRAIREENISATAKLVGYTLTEYADAEGRVPGNGGAQGPSHETLARDAGLGLKGHALRSAIAALEAADLVAVDRGRGQRAGGERGWRYQLLLPEVTPGLAGGYLPTEVTPGVEGTAAVQVQVHDQDLGLGVTGGTREIDRTPEIGKETAAADPATEREIREIVASLPGADRQSLNVVEPFAKVVPRGVLIELAERARLARNPVGWLVVRLRAARAETRIELAAPPRAPAPIERLSPEEALKANVLHLAKNGHSWETVSEHVAAAYGEEHLEAAHAVYGGAA